MVLQEGIDFTSMTPAQVEKLWNGPARKPPPGVVPNLDNPKDLTTDFLILCIVGCIVTGIFVAIRLYTRWALVRRLIIEDFVLLAGWIMFVCGMNTQVFQALKYHLGAHIWDIRLKNLDPYLHLFHYGVLTFCVAMLLIRIAIIMQILRHFVPKGARNFTFWFAQILIILNTGFWAALTFMEIFACDPMEGAWKPWVKAQCLDRHAYLIASGVMNLASEILLMFLPQRVIWKLALSTKQKLELTPLFLVGILTCVCSIVRLYETLAQWPTDDETFYIADAVMLWTVPEVACCILVTCLPSVPQFIRLMRRRATRPVTTVFQMPKAANGGRSWNGAVKHNKKPIRTIVSDLEYHELVMRTETTVDVVERDSNDPWVQPPATVHIQGGQGPTKVFRTPIHFRNDIGIPTKPDPPPEISEIGAAR